VPSAQLDRSCDILIRAGLSRARDLRARGASWLVQLLDNRRIIRWLDVALDRRIRNAHVREVGQWKREIIRTKRRLGRVLKNRRTEIDRFRVVN
jgi:hypothetical protein